MKLCEVCPKRDKCKTLCEKAEAWASKDYVSQREWSGFESKSDSPDAHRMSSELELLAYGAQLGGSNVITEKKGTQALEIELDRHLKEIGGRRIQTPMRASWEEIQEGAQAPFPEYPFLKDIENKILKAYYADALSYREIARKFGKKQNTIKSMLARAKAKIASNFSKRGELIPIKTPDKARKK